MPQNAGNMSRFEDYIFASPGDSEHSIRFAKPDGLPTLQDGHLLQLVRHRGFLKQTH
ncbi:MAG: hypothetical protein WCH99_17375 [Verrucomicrobiota bacterium]